MPDGMTEINTPGGLTGVIIGGPGADPKTLNVDELTKAAAGAADPAKAAEEAAAAKAADDAKKAEEAKAAEAAKAAKAEGRQDKDFMRIPKTDFQKRLDRAGRQALGKLADELGYKSIEEMKSAFDADKAAKDKAKPKEEREADAARKREADERKRNDEIAEAKREAAEAKARVTEIEEETRMQRAESETRMAAISEQILDSDVQELALLAWKKHAMKNLDDGVWKEDDDVTPHLKTFMKEWKEKRPHLFGNGKAATTVVEGTAKPTLTAGAVKNWMEADKKDWLKRQREILSREG